MGKVEPAGAQKWFHTHVSDTQGRVCQSGVPYICGAHCWALEALLPLTLTQDPMKPLAAVALFFCAITTMSAQDELLRSALSSFGLDSATVGYRPQPTWGPVPRSDPFRLPYFDGLLARPLKIPNFTREMLFRYTVWMTGDSSNFATPTQRKVRPLAGLIYNSARNLGHDVGRYGFDYTPVVPADRPLAQTLERVLRADARDPGNVIVYPLPTQDWSNDVRNAELQAQKLPPGLERVVASLLIAIDEAAVWRNRSLAAIPRAQWPYIYRTTTLEESQCDAHTFDQTVYDAAAAFDVMSASWGASLLAQAVEKAVPELRSFLGHTVSLDLPTPLGRVIIAGGGNDVHYASDCALLIDLGGDDSYFGPAGAASHERPVSVLIDLSGNDRYENRHSGIAAQGAGVLGFGLLLDLGGNDSYSSRTFSQGCGRFGVGLLYDESGKDTYSSDGFSQGAGMYGIGILFDRAGDDSYSTVYYAQGYGFSAGLGLLADGSGDDSYIADDTQLTHVGDETPKHNESDAQGYGAGRRGDHTDGHNMSGGLGILHDLSGDDSYSAGVFAQGSGYWYGMGVLNDHAGDDTYRGVFFNLGAAAHFAIGALFDDAGDDRTDLVMTLGLGTAHDASAAIYIDADGNDSYTMSNGDDRACSLGSALNNSFALFLNIRGNDSYAPVGNALGYATARQRGEWVIYAPSTGLFFDIGGRDTYTFRFGGENSSWSTSDKKTPGVFTLGRDVEQGSIRFE